MQTQTQTQTQTDRQSSLIDVGSSALRKDKDRLFDPRFLAVKDNNWFDKRTNLSKLTISRMMIDGAIPTTMYNSVSNHLYLQQKQKLQSGEIHRRWYLKDINDAASHVKGKSYINS
jgi:hypothetical protein